MQVWLVDVGHMVLLEHTLSLPCPLVPILFPPVRSYNFFNLFKKMICASIPSSHQIHLFDTDVPGKIPFQEYADTLSPRFELAKFKTVNVHVPIIIDGNDITM